MDAENQSPQTVREDRTKNRYDPFECFERAFESQFVHEEHDEDLHSKGAGLCPRPCLTGQRHLHLLLPRRLELKVCAPPALARHIPHPSPLTCRLTR